MKHLGGTRAKALMGTAILSSVVFLSASGAAKADWIQDMMDPSCDPAVANDIASGIRESIEDSVARAEASIRAAVPTADLSCLNGLMDAPLDIFSNIGGIMGNLSGGISGMLDPGGLVGQAGETVNRQVCQFAQDKWNEVTQPLTGGLDDLSIPSIADAFGSINSDGESYFNSPSDPTNSSSQLGTADLSGDPFNPADGVDDSPTQPEDDPVTQMQNFQQAMQCHSQAQTSGGGRGEENYAVGSDQYNTRFQQCLDQNGITDIFGVNGFSESSNRTAIAPSVQQPQTAASPTTSLSSQMFSPENNPGAAAAENAPAARSPENDTPQGQIWNMMNGGSTASSN